MNQFDKKVRSDAYWLGFVILAMLIFAGSASSPISFFNLAVALFGVVQLVRLVRREQRYQELLAGE